MRLTWTLQQGMNLQAFSASDRVAVLCQQRVEFDQLEVELMVHASTSLKVVLYQEKCNVIVKWLTVSQQLLTLVIFRASSVDSWVMMIRCMHVLIVALWRTITNVPTYDKAYSLQLIKSRLYSSIHTLLPARHMWCHHIIILWWICRMVIWRTVVEWCKWGRSACNSTISL